MSSSTHDAYEPRLRVRSSGHGGSGYVLPSEPGIAGKLKIVPGVTTVLGALDKPGVVQWAVDNTAAYAVANIDALLNRSDEQGFGFLRWYHKRNPDFDDPTIDIRDVSNGILNDLAELGTLTHDWIADNINGLFEPELVRPEQTAMIEAYLDWRELHDITPVITEATVFDPHEGYAGTLDHVWRIKCNHEDPCIPGADKDSVLTLVDVKTSRAVHDTHIAQLAALRDAPHLYVQDDESGQYPYTSRQWGDTRWNVADNPEVEECAVLQVRPDDTDKHGNPIPAFCQLHHIDRGTVDAAKEIFLGALRVRHGEAALKRAKKNAGR